MNRTRTATLEIAHGRLAKAKQFLDAAQTVRDFAEDEAKVGDALVTLCVHAASPRRTPSAASRSESIRVARITTKR